MIHGVKRTAVMTKMLSWDAVAHLNLHQNQQVQENRYLFRVTTEWPRWSTKTMVQSKEELRSSIMVSGVLSVMIPSSSQKLMFSADLWDLLRLILSHQLMIMIAQEEVMDRFSWTIFNVLVKRLSWKTVDSQDGVTTTAVMVKMPLLHAADKEHR